jgi:protein SCO1
VRKSSRPARYRRAKAIGVALLLFSTRLAFADTLGSAASASDTPASVLQQDRALQISQAAIGGGLGDYSLLNSAGSVVKLSSYRGKPLLVNFIYTGCFQVCPTATRTLKRAVESAQRALGPQAFHAVSIGFNLPFDTPDALGAFAREQGATLPGWDFLSPDASTLAALTRELGFSYAPSPRGFDHILQITILDADGRVYRQVYGDDFPVPQVVGPLKELITGTPRKQETLTGFFERVRLLCTVYDPASGTYRLKTSLLFELAGGVLGLVAMGWLFLREVRHSRAARAKSS